MASNENLTRILLSRWRNLILISIVILIIIFSYGPRLPVPSTTRASSQQDWKYSWVRDRDNYRLSESQCDAAFPDLYYEIDRAAARWQHGRITYDSIELHERNTAGVRLLLENNQLRVLSSKGYWFRPWRVRIDSLFEQIDRAIISAPLVDGKFPNTEFTISVGDWANIPPNLNRTAWSFSREAANSTHEDLWIIPDFHFDLAPPESRGFLEMQARARWHDSPITEKEPKAFWRGAIPWDPLMPGSQLRYDLLNVTDGHIEWADVAQVSFQDEERRNFVRLDEFCDYQFLINTEGVSFSSRLMYILNCDSIPVVHDRRYIAHFYHLLEPNVNYVPVFRNFSDLERQIKSFRLDTTAAQRIADQAKKTFREQYITAAATTCYWRRLLRTWGTIAFEPEIFDGENGQKRGTPLDEFRKNYKRGGDHQ